MRWVAVVAIVLIIGAALWWSGMPGWMHLGRSGPMSAGAGPMSPPSDISGPIELALPASLSSEEARGSVLFADDCAVCHGENAAGGDSGPPLVHVIYEPGHHGDEAFHRAVVQGVRAHHWRLGDMPPIANVTRAQVDQIITYLRALQRENGIR